MVYTDRIHLVADSVDELHAFASEISLKRHFFHGVRKGHPHYDLTNAQTVTKAINHGAKIVTTKELLKICPDVNYKYIQDTRTTGQPIDRRNKLYRNPMAKIREVKIVHAHKKLYHFMCPACKYAHSFNDKWTFNNDFDNPTVSPSILMNELAGEKPSTCHSFIKAGKIQFLGDCTHKLAGQTVDLPDF